MTTTMLARRGRRDRGARRRLGTIAHLALAGVCYLPLLLTAHGRLAADTRQAVYLDPGRFLSDALSMWDPSRDLGTVTHQNIVLVWPMGVWYWLAHTVGLPLWVAQRLWLGSILFLAGAGVLYLARTIHWGSDRSTGALVAIGPVVAAFTYAMTPYVLQYGTRTSVLLLPWAALPWLIALTARALETKGWRHPALFALVTLSIAVNATALVLALLGPALWIAWSVWGTRDVAWRDAWRAALRIGVLTAVTSLWWVVALLIEGRYGMPLLSFTETIEQVASTSVATEVLRGLGYWVPYLQQHGWPEVSGAHVYLDNLPVMAVQFAVLLLVFAGIVSLRWRHRTYFGMLVVVGLVVGIGAYPTTSPSPLSSFFEDFARSSGIGLALRSTTRAAPLALLGLACLLGAAVDALVRRAPRTGRTVAVGSVLVAVLLAPSIAGADLVDPLYSRPEQIPGYWTAAIAAADHAAGDGRMLEIPGTRYAAYKWGNTYEPITAGLAKTPTAWREQIPYGGPGSADMLVALDNRIQEGTLDPSALAPVARLLGVNQLLVRNDLQYERYDTVSPDRVWALVSGSVPGLLAPQGFGPVGTNTSDPATRRADEPQPADPSATYPALALVPVTKSRGLVQMLPVSSTVVLDGNGDGIVDAASAGVIDGQAPVLYAATAAQDPAALKRALAAGARIVLTDTNRRRVQRWRSISDTTGITLRANEDPAAYDGGPGGEASLDLFPGAGQQWQTVALQQGAQVTATRYGNPLTFEPAFRPAAALDGDPDTAWQVGPTIGGVGDRLTVRLDTPVTTDHLTITGTRENTVLTSVDLRFDGGAPVHVALDETSRGPGGQTVTFPARTFSELSVEITGTEDTSSAIGPSEVGIAELGIPGVTFDQTVRLPTALTGRLGPASAASPLSIVLTRQRGDVTKPQDGGFVEERVIARTFRLPTARSFSVSGTARAAAGTDAASLGSAVTGACRDDLLTVDGHAVPVRLVPDVSASAGPATGSASPVGLESCGPVELGAGRHVLRTSSREVDVDQLALSSDAGGTATPLTAAARPELPPAPDATPVRWTQDSNSRVTAHTGRTDGPSWLVLAQSYNTGWQATGGRHGDPQGPVLMNGFANAWYVAGAQRAPTTYSLRWTPQRTMNFALALSALGVLAALLLVVRGRRWQPVVATGAPELDAPWAGSARVATTPLVVTAVVTGVAAGLLIGPAWGVLTAAFVAVAGRWRRGHALLTAGVVGALALAFGAVVVDRVDHRHQTAFNFFTSLHTPHRLALFGIVLFAVDLVFARLRPASPVEDPVDDLHRLRSRVSAATQRLLPPAAGGDTGPEATVESPAESPVESPVEAPAEPRPSPSHRRRFALWWGAGSALGALLFTWMATGGSFRLFGWYPTADFYDAQAHQLLGGHLDVPRRVLGIEAFVVGGKSYMYQGPWPAVLRFPVALFTHALDGRLAVVSMLVAFVVASVALGLLTWDVRRLVRGDGAIGPVERWLLAAFAFACTGGSIMVFEASEVSVYHESAMWGIAMALLAFWAILRHLLRPGRWTLAVAALFATLTLMSRASLGLGAVAALGLVLLGELTAWWRARRNRPGPAWAAWLRPGRPAARRAVVLTAVACAVPVLLYASLNVAKFGTPLSVPWEKQVFTEVSSARRDFLAENNDTFFGPQFVPTTLVEYLRPDAFRLDDRFPYLGFDASQIGREVGLGGVRFDKIDATGSVPVSFPLLCVLGLVGIAAVVMLRRARPRLRLLTAPLLGAAASAGTILVFGFIAQRYLGDVLPFLALASIVGFVALGAVLPRCSTRVRRGTVAVLVALGLVATWVTFAQSYWYQRVFASPGTEAATGGFVRARNDLPTLPGLHSLTPVTRGSHLPARGDAGQLFVVGDCDGVYVSDGATVDELSHTNWKPVARTPAVGAYDVDLTFPDAPAGTQDPLLVSGTADHPNVLAVEYLGDDHVRFVYRGAGIEGAGPAVHVTPGKTYRARLALDPETDFSTVRLGDRTVWSGVYTADDIARLGVNHLDGSTRARFGGTISQRPVSKALCRSLLAGQ